MTASVIAQRAPVIVVAIGASNTWGWGVAGRNAYPERLEDLLKAAGYDAQVINAGTIFDTTAGMRRRIDTAVPDGTDIVILQPGGNDVRFFGSNEQRAVNIEAIVKRLTERKIAVIVYDPVFPQAAYQWDRIHLNADAHGKIAMELLSRVKGMIDAKASEGRQR